MMRALYLVPFTPLLFPLIALVVPACANSGEGGFLPDDGGVVDAPSDAAKPDAGGDGTDAGSDADVPDADTDSGAWPTCDTKPASSLAQGIPDLFTASSPKPVEIWLHDVYVTAISGSACEANKACQIFVQDATYTTLAQAAHHAIKVFISASAAHYFVGVGVNDKIDLDGWAWRYDVGGQNEELVQINDALHGCAKKTANASFVVQPVPVQLSDLTVNAYETTVGPVLVQLSNVSGKPDPVLTKTFGLYPTTDGGGFDGGSTEIVSLSPYFLPNGTFTGLTGNVKTNFATLTGVFGLFVPPQDAGTPTKYLELYPRTPADIVTQ